MKRLAAENGERSTAVRGVWGLADKHGSRRHHLDHVRVRQGIQRACVTSSRLRLAVLSAEYVSTWAPRLVAGHTNSHNNLGRRPRNDLRLPGAFVEQKANQANRNLAPINREHQRHTEGSSG